MFFHRKSFTLIELMVVIAIIALISSIFAVYVSVNRAGARDARRLSDVHIIETALELYYAKFGEYPTFEPPEDWPFGGWDVGNIALEEHHTFIEPLVEKGIMARVPVDPNPKLVTRSSYLYYRYEKGEYAPCGDIAFAVLAVYLERGLPVNVSSRINPCYDIGEGGGLEYPINWYAVMKIEY